MQTLLRLVPLSDAAGTICCMDWITPNELACDLKVNTKTLANWRYLGRGPSFLKDGGVVRYRRKDVEAWEREHTVTPKDAS